jgi:hypothetical protein
VGLRRAPLRFAYEAAFLVAVGVALAAADVELLPFVVVMTVTWVLVATAERMLSRPGVALPSLTRRAPDDGGELLPVPRAYASAPEPPRAEPEPAGDERRGLEPQRLEAVPDPEQEPEPEPELEEEEPDELVPQPHQAAQRRPEGWNLWDLELRARELAGDRLRDEEWHALFVSLREFAQPDGTLPSDFDALVQESFGELIASRP